MIFPHAQRLVRVFFYYFESVFERKNHTKIQSFSKFIFLMLEWNVPIKIKIYMHQKMGKHRLINFLNCPFRSF